MKVEIRPDENGQKTFTIYWPKSELEFLLVERGSKISYSKEAVYILMDKFRQRFYIGETGSTKGGGVVNRLRVHKWKKNFWDCALVIIDPHGGFGRDDDRRWYEWRLFEIAKEFSKGEEAVEILSSAAEQNKPYGAEETLKVILSVCRLIGISWAFYEEEGHETESSTKKGTTKKKPKAAKKPAKTKPSAKGSPKKGLNQTQVAKYIANRIGKQGSYGHIWLILAGKGNKNGRKCGKGSELRKPMEEVGIKFDDDDYVIDWKDAKIPV